jgi:hypothetical protein
VCRHCTVQQLKAVGGVLTRLHTAFPPASAIRRYTEGLDMSQSRVFFAQTRDAAARRMADAESIHMHCSVGDQHGRSALFVLPGQRDMSSPRMQAWGRTVVEGGRVAAGENELLRHCEEEWLAFERRQQAPSRLSAGSSDVRGSSSMKRSNGKPRPKRAEHEGSRRRALGPSRPPPHTTVRRSRRRHS